MGRKFKRNIIDCPINKEKKAHGQTTIRKTTFENFPGGTVDRHLPANAGYTGLTPGPATCLRQVKTKSHNYRAPMPQLLRPMHRDPAHHGKRSHWNETPKDGNKD